MTENKAIRGFGKISQLSKGQFYKNSPLCWRDTAAGNKIKGPQKMQEEEVKLPLFMDDLITHVKTS